MKSQAYLVVAICAVVLLMVGTAAGQHTRDFKMTMSGSGGFPLAAEIEGNPVGLSLCAGKSTLPGSSFTCTTVGYQVDEYVGEDTELCPLGIELETAEAEYNHVTRFSTGDVLYTVPDPDSYNYLCYYGTYAIMESHWLIVGGSGTYEGATGTSFCRGQVDFLPLGPYSTLGYHPLECEGTITLVK